MPYRRLFQRLFGRSRQGGAATPPESQAPSAYEVLQLGDVFLAPASVSRARAEQALGPSGSTSEASPLLVVPEVARAALEAPQDMDRDYGPNAAVEWVLDLAFSGPVVVTTAELDVAYAREHLPSVQGFTLYGLPEGGVHWTYVHAGGSPARWRAVAISTDLLGPGDEGSAVTLVGLRAFHREALRQARFVEGARAVPREQAEVAAERALRFAQARRDADVDARVVLRAPALPGFDGRRVWDALNALGLEWGDMDLFHWPNPSAVGHDSFFDVWTSTPPGYFLPEEIRAGRLHAEDLVFGFRIARSADPHAVLSQMVEAARFVQRRLGGRLEDDEGAPYDEQVGHVQVRCVVDRLGQVGLRPGEDATLRIF